MGWQALDKDQERRPTPLQLAEHPFFRVLYVLPFSIVVRRC